MALSTTIKCIPCTGDNCTVFHQVCSGLRAITEENRIELVGSISRDDEFSIISVSYIINVAASDICDDPVELDDFVYVRKLFVLREPNGEVHIW